MAGISIKSNSQSLVAQRHLGNAAQRVERSSSRLSSGLRINRGVDDASGLQIAKGLEADHAVFGQAVRNLNDGISALQIADGALSELNNINTRLVELAEQSANGTLNFRQRQALDKEAQQLALEYSRIIQTTEFNGRNLLNGSEESLTLQAGYGAASALDASVGGDVGDGTWGAAIDNGSGANGNVDIGDINQDGLIDVVQSTNVMLSNGDGTFSVNSALGFNAAILGDVNGDGHLDAIGGVGGANAIVSLGNGDGTFQGQYSFGVGGGIGGIEVGDFNNDGKEEIIVGTGASEFRTYSFSAPGNEALLGTTSHFGIAKTDSVNDYNNDGNLDLLVTDGDTTANILYGDGTGAFQVSTITAGANTSVANQGDFNSDGHIDIITANADNSINVFLNDGSGNFTNSNQAVAVGTNGVTVADFNGDGNADILSGGATQVLVNFGNGDGTFQTSSVVGTVGGSSEVRAFDLNSDSVVDAISARNIQTFITDTADGAAGIGPFSLRSATTAREALSIFNTQIQNVALQRGVLGANMSRLESDVANLEGTVLDTKNAQSRIEDVEVADESANFTKSQIMQQIATSVLAQANQNSTVALGLLQNI